MAGAFDTLRRSRKYHNFMARGFTQPNAVRIATEGISGIYPSLL
jgi:hypothetical protein